jgi:hypothetical protein
VFLDAAAVLGCEAVNAFLYAMVDRSGHLGRLNTSLRQLRRLRPQGILRRGQPPDDMQLAVSRLVLAPPNTRLQPTAAFHRAKDLRNERVAAEARR